MFWSIINKTVTEEAFCSSLNQENENGTQTEARRNQRQKERSFPFSSVVSSAFVTYIEA